MERSPQPPASPDFAQLLLNARAGCKDSLGTVLEFCRDYLLCIALKKIPPRLRPKGSPSDLVQTTFAEALRDFAHFDGQTREELLAWLRCLLLDNCADLGRRFGAEGKRDVGLERPMEDRISQGVDDPEGPARQAERQEEADLVQRALWALPEPYWQVIHLRRFLRLSWEEVGALMGCSREAARMFHCRAMRTLGRLLYPGRLKQPVD